MSRCGSTPASQMLAASGANIVVSEASPIEAVVRLAAGDDDGSGCCGRWSWRSVRSGTRATRYFLKLDSWHACALPLFRAAFPRTPWAFLYRDPVAVMVSHARRTGMQMVADLLSTGFYGLDPGGQTWAKTIGPGCSAQSAPPPLREYPAGGGVLVNYDELPEAVCTRLLPHFGVTPAPEEVETMAAAPASTRRRRARASLRTRQRSGARRRQGSRRLFSAACRGLATRRQSSCFPSSQRCFLAWMNFCAERLRS